MYSTKIATVVYVQDHSLGKMLSILLQGQRSTANHLQQKYVLHLIPFVTLL